MQPNAKSSVKIIQDQAHSTFRFQEKLIRTGCLRTDEIGQALNKDKLLFNPFQYMMFGTHNHFEIIS